MTATNHALTGALLGLTVGNPWVALPAALVSHFVCDAIPHFGQGQASKHWIGTAAFRRMLFVDAALCVVLVGFLWAQHPLHWLLAAICAFLATAPDLFWLGDFRRALQKRQAVKHRGFLLFAGVIQWFQQPIGIMVEVAWLAAMLILLRPFLS